MNEQQFINQNVHTWQEAESLAKLIEKKGYKTKKQVDEFLNLYSHISENLSYARTYYNDSDSCQYLNDLTLKIHNLIYIKEKTRKNNILRFFTKDFRNSIHKNSIFILIAFLVFIIGALISYSLTVSDYNNIYAFLPKQMVNSINVNGPGYVDKPVMSSQIMTNNIQVCFESFVLGITLAIGTLYILFTNGALIGAFIAYVELNHLSFLKFISLLAPHGFIELFAIFISGAAGIKLGLAILNPGEYSRLDSVLLKAKESAYLIIGIIFLLIIAGTIEGFITPSKIAPISKIYFGITTLLLIILYVFPWERLKKNKEKV